MSRKLLFIVNPRSGKKNSGKVIDIITKEIPTNVEYEIGLWTNIGEFNILADKLKSQNFTDAIAVGGDGSVNLVGKTVLNKNITLGIIPTGSGNGLARSLGYKMEISEALKQIIEGKTTLIDSGTVNGSPFFCTSGIGFDARIGNLFTTAAKRGLRSYIKMIFKEYFSYQPNTYFLKFEGKEFSKRAFLITIANAGQYGNNFYIAPQAKINDGLFHIAILKPFSFLQSIGIVLKIMNRKADRSRFIETHTCKELKIIRGKNDAIHFDGEPEVLGTELHYTLNPKSVKVIVGDKFDGV